MALMVCLRLVITVFIFVLSTNFVSGRKSPPLLDDEGVKIRNKAAECVFGKQTRELGSTWIPDLGVPIGVLYCMRCRCVPILKKNRIVAKVQCQSIKKECPETTCENPIYLPDRCCRTCPGDTKTPEIVQDIVPQNVIEEEERSTKHYAALLTGRSSLVLKNDIMKPIPNDLNKNNIVATGRFTFHRKNLHYSFHISEKAARPHSLQFVDNDDNILEEFILSYPGGYVNSVYQNATRKVCGVWRRLPRDYRKLLKQEKLYVVLVWGTKDQAEFTISGLIIRNVALATELFSSLLEPAPGSSSLMMTGAGGTAIVSTSTSYTPSVNIAVIFNGLFSENETSDVPLNITLMMEDKRQIIMHETVIVSKPAPDLNVVDISSPVSTAHLRLLTRGRLVVSISSTLKPEALKLSGNVITKISCEIFQATLSSQHSNPNGVSGMAWLYLNNVGSLVYNIQIDSLPNETPVIITLTDVSTKKRTELEDLTPYFHNDGWANGTIDKLSPRVLDPLYSSNLAVNLATLTDASLIKGRLIAKPVADAMDAATPILLKRDNPTLPPNVVGMAWLSIDIDCHLNYDVTLSGIGDKKKFHLFMDMYPRIAPGAPFMTKELEDFQGNQVEGSPVEALTLQEITRLEKGVSFLKVMDLEAQVVMLKGTVTKVLIPPTCKPTYTLPDNNVPNLSDPIEIFTASQCLFEEKFFESDTTWVSSKNPCKTCFCQNGVAKCDNMTCPDLVCPHGKKVQVEGECCPVCAINSINSNSDTNKCSFNGRAYSPGSKFHPFLIPSGFDLCTECVCDPTIMEIKCTRLNDHDKSCCRNCDKKSAVATDLNDPMGDDNVPSYLPVYQKPNNANVQKILDEGGCKNLNNLKKPYLNGSEYHPMVGSLGEYKCVTCKCKDGTSNCQRQRCDLNTCKKMFDLRRKKEKINHSEFCCLMKECRRMRHRKRTHTS